MKVLDRDPLFALVAFLSALTATALALTGQTSVLAFAVLPCLPLGAALGLRERPPSRLFNLAFQVGALVMLAFFATSVLRGRILAGAVTLTVLVQAFYLLQLPTRETLTRLTLISFFQVIALAASTTRVLFLPALLAWLAVAPIAFTLAALESAAGEEDGGPRRPASLPRPLVRHGLIAAACLAVVGSLTWVVLPRYEVGAFHRLSAQSGKRVSGFSEEVSFGDIGRILESDALVMRIDLGGAELPEDLRWRGLALDEFTGRSWSISPTERFIRTGGALPSAAGARGPAITQSIRLEPDAPSVVFRLPGATHVDTGDWRGVEVDRQGNLWGWGAAPGRVRYEVVSRPATPRDASLDEVELERYLQLPEIDARIAELADELAPNTLPPSERAARLERALREQWPYSLDVNDRGLEDPLARFLLERAPGHCEYFASGMVVMLRSQGIPARLVNGFHGGERARFRGDWLVRQRDAHAWLEAWLPGQGWTTFDPTPARPVPPPVGFRQGVRDGWTWIETTWDDHVIGFSFNDQLGMLITLRDALVALLRRLGESRATALVAVAVLTVTLAGVGLALARAARRRAGVGAARRIPVRDVERAFALLARRGWRRGRGTTPAELARALKREAPEAGEAAEELVRRYYATRFGGAEWSTREGRRLLETLRRSVPRRAA